MAEHLDVLVVGAGLSGIAAGYHLQTACPDRTYAILEGRDSIGGTWDLFQCLDRRLHARILGHDVPGSSCEHVRQAGHPLQVYFWPQAQ